jgi:hypothetical protein
MQITMMNMLVVAVAMSQTASGGIQWYTDLEQGLREAWDTGRPIFLLSAAPNCSEVPGQW